jgi:putative hydrolase of the HAD superfamily
MASHRSQKGSKTSQKKQRAIPSTECVIFDGDDTLWSTMPLYEAAKSDFQTLMRRFDPEFDLSELEIIDSNNVDKYGFCKERFATSMIDTYRALANRKRRTPSRVIEERVKKIANRVFIQTAPVFAEASRVLESLSRFRLVLLTKGDRRVQASRITDSGLKHYFHRIYITPVKGTDEFRHIIAQEQVRPSMTWSVGDSFRSDIKPALTVGLNAIWIHRDTWLFESEGQPSEQIGFHRCGSLEAILTIIR